MKRHKAGRLEILLIITPLFLLLASVVLRPASIAYASGSAVTSETLTSTDAPQTFTASLLHQTTGTFINQYATAALIVVETNNIRMTEDGSAPTQGASGHGYIVQAGYWRYIRGGANVRATQFISAKTGYPATIQITYYFGGE